MTKQAAIKDFESIDSRAGKYLTFALGDEQYGLGILNVREIIKYIETTAVPQVPGYVKGIINLRGQVIPVVDIRAKFAMTAVDVTEETCIVVVEIDRDGVKTSTGIVVDRVSEVVDIESGCIEDSPDFGTAVNTEFILGMGKFGESVKILLDIEKILASEDLAGITETD